MTQAKRRQGYGAKLDDLDLLLAVAPDRDVQVQTIPPEATRIDTGQSPEDFVSEFGQTFSRAQFAGGEGLAFAHRERSESDRYWDSNGVDVSLPDPGNRHTARLLSDTDKLISTTFLLPAIVTDGSSIWMADDTDVQRTDDPLSSSPSFTAESVGSSIRGLAVLGNEVYAGLGASGINQRSSSGTWSSWSDLESTLLWSVKGRIIARGGGNNDEQELYEARSGSDSVKLSTLPPGKLWRSVVDAGAHILAGADDGSIYAFSASEDADLTLENRTEVPGEAVRSLAVLGGVVLIGTFVETKSNGFLGRLWRGLISGDGTVTEMSLVTQWGDENSTTFHSPTFITVARDSAYVGMAEENDSGNVDMYLWRYDFVTGGISRHLAGPSGLSPGATNHLHNALALGGQLFFTEREDALYRQSLSTYTTSGYLITPAADFFTSLDKSWLRITVDADLPTGDDGTDTKVEAYYATDLDAMDDPNSSLWTLVGTLDPSSTDDEFDITGAQSRFIVLKVDLSASTDQTETPQLFSVSVTANVIGEEVSITLPVNVSDRHERFGRRPVRRKVGTGKTMFQNLLDKRGKSVDLELYRHGLTVRGIVQEIQTPTQSITPRGSPTVYSLVTFRGTIVSKS